MKKLFEYAAIDDAISKIVEITNFKNSLFTCAPAKLTRTLSQKEFKKIKILEGRFNPKLQAFVYQ